NDLIRVLPVGFPILFSDASCTATSEQELSEQQLQSTSTPSGEYNNTSSNVAPKPRVFKGKDDCRFTTFMNHPEISEIINEYFEKMNLAQHGDYLRNRHEIHEVVAMSLYHYCMHMKCGLLNEDGSLKEEAIQETEEFLWDSYLLKSKLYLAVSEFEFDHIPIKTLKFLIDHCGVKE
ncbi:uncharacterized protein VICG_02240, partial [Vittaforma corneae ATCC 50505]